MVKVKPIFVSVLIGLVVGLVLLMCRKDLRSVEDAPMGESVSSKGEAVSRPLQGKNGPSDCKSGPKEVASPLQEAEEAAVDAFDALTDKWMEPVKAGVTMKDVDGFVATFRKIPKGRQDECIHRALNLIPDENVMLLAGILMDKTIDKEIVETVFNDILNRDEDVKKPILQQIFRDKSHPCHADAAWILDVTGENH